MINKYVYALYVVELIGALISIPVSMLIFGEVGVFAGLGIMLVVWVHLNGVDKRKVGID